MNRTGLALALALPMLSAAHDVPDEVRIRGFLKPDHGRMTILIRIPANALIDILFPTLPESGWLDLRHAHGFAAEGARVWVADLINLYEDGQPLPAPRVVKVRITQMPDDAFRAFPKALRHLDQSGSDDDLFTQDEAGLDVALETPIRSASSNFSIDPRFARVGVRVTTSLTFLAADGGVRQFEYDGDPGRIHLDPTRANAIAGSIRGGYLHFFSATDYLLFLLSVALLLRAPAQLVRFTALLMIVQLLSFLGAAFGLLLSALWMEAIWGVLVAAVVAYVGFDAIVGGASPAHQRTLAVISGFVFGTGYWFGFRPEMQFAGSHKLAAVLAFDGGILICQILVLATAAGLVTLLQRLSFAPRATAIIAAAILLRISWHHMLDRARSLGAAPVTWPSVSPFMIATSAALLAGLVGWSAYRRWHTLSRGWPSGR